MSMARRNSLLGGALGALTLVSVSSLGAEAGDRVTVRLEWKQAAGASSCIDAEALSRAVTRRFQRQGFTDAPDADIVVKGTVKGERDRSWTAVIELERANGESLGTRTLTTTAPDCSALDDAVVLATGLMIDVSRRRVDDERTGTTTPPLGKPAAPITIPRDTAAPRAPWHVEPAFGIEAALGLIPAIGLAGRAGVAIEPPHSFRLELAADYWLPRDDRDNAGRGARWELFTAELGVCPFVYRQGGFSSNACAFQRFGEVRVAGFGFDQARSSFEPIWTAGARVGGAQTVLGPLAVRFGVGLEVPILRYRFVYSDEDAATRVLRRMSAIVGSAELGLSLRW
jgi:hypothetical protein